MSADSGLPLFTKCTGNLTPLSFATVGVLNGVHMFTTLKDSELKTAVTPEEKIVWKVYHDCVVLILIARHDAMEDIHFTNLLDNIFASMVLMSGLDIILKPANIEKLKRELKSCYELVDYLLKQADEENYTVGSLTQKADIMLSYNSQALMPYLEKFLKAADSAYGCLLVKGKIVIASKQWWSLSSQEVVLLSALVNSLPKATAREVPVFLPASCPRASNRLVILQLLKGIELCILCDATPLLSELDDEAHKIWKGSFDLLKAAYSLHPRNFPTNIELDPNIVSLLLLNKDLKHSLFTVCPIQDESLLKDAQQLLLRHEAMATFYKMTVGTFFTEEDSLSNDSKTSNTLKNNNNTTTALEYYMCTEQHKCYAINSINYQLFLIFNKSVPHYALRPVAQKTLQQFTSKKFIQKCGIS